MDFNLTEQQRMFRDAVAAFARKGLAEGSLARAHTPEFPRDVAKKMAARGCSASRLPRRTEAMINDVRELAVPRGYRNLPRADCAALAHAIRALSLLALLDARTVNEVEINPLIVKADGEGVVAVDGLVVFGNRQQATGS